MEVAGQSFLNLESHGYCSLTCGRMSAVGASTKRAAYHIKNFPEGNRGNIVPAGSFWNPDSNCRFPNAHLQGIRTV